MKASRGFQLMWPNTISADKGHDSTFAGSCSANRHAHSTARLPPDYASAPIQIATVRKAVLHYRRVRRYLFNNAINQVESARNQADQSVNDFLSGEGDDLHSTILSVQRADLEFQLAMQVKNKVVSAYQEVMRMQL